MQQQTENHRDLYLMLSPGHESLRIVHCNDGIEGFRSFIDKNIDQALKTPMVPDNWLLHYRLPEDASREIPQLAERPCREYFKRLSPKLAAQGISPEHIVRLRDAVYCRESKIPLLTPEAAYIAISKRADYIYKQIGYGAYIPELKGVLPDFHACNAVELAEGVLLFSPTPKGDRLLHTMMGEIASNFFDARMKQTAMRMYQLPLFDPTWKPFVDSYKQGMIVNNWGPAQIGTLTYLDISVLRNGIATGEFDLSPTPKAYWELAKADIFGLKPYENAPTNQMTAHMLYIKEHGRMPDPKESGQCKVAAAFVYLHKEEGPEALKAKAADLLKLDCPNLRQVPPKETRHVPSITTQKSTQSIHQ